MASNLARHLLLLWAKGHLSAAQIQLIAAEGRKDGWAPQCPLASRLATLGSSGTITGHLARDIVAAARIAGLLSTTAQPYEFKLPGGGGNFSAFLPHEIVHEMVLQNGLANLCLSHDELDSPVGVGSMVKKWAAHMDVQYHGDSTEVVGVGIHGDGVAYTTSIRPGGAKGILVVSMNIVTTQDDRIKNRRQPLFVMKKSRACTCGCNGYHTTQAIFAIIAWSLQILAAGRSPSCRHDGSPWTSDDRKHRLSSSIPIAIAALIQIRGDWEFFESAFHVRSIGSDLFCWMCQACKSLGRNNYKQFSEQADHRDTLISHSQYVEACVADMTDPPTIFQAPGVEIDVFGIDSMHGGDLGCFPDAIGSLFWLEISHRGFCPNRTVGLTRLNEQLKAFYSANPERRYSQIGTVVISQIISKGLGYPYLKAKAAQTRHLAEFCQALAYRHRRGGDGKPPFQFPRRHALAAHTDVHLNHLCSMFDGLVDYHRACAAKPFVPDRCKTSMLKFLDSLSSLNELWRAHIPEAQHCSQPFHMRQKAHMLLHLVLDKISLWGSPSQFWNYRDEDFIGAIKRMAATSRFPATIEKRLREKLMILAGLHTYV